MSVHVSNLFRHRLTLRKHKTCTQPITHKRCQGIYRPYWRFFTPILLFKQFPQRSQTLFGILPPCLPHSSHARRRSSLYYSTCESINLASWPPVGLIKVDRPQPVPLVHGTTKCFEMSYIDTNLCMLSTIKQRQAVLNTVSVSSMLDTRVSLYSAPARRTST